MIEVNNLARIRVDERFLKKIAERVLKGEQKEKQSLSIALVNPKRMQELNKQYRGKDSVANVLSFAEAEFGLGEVVLCPQEIRKEAVKYGMMFEQAFAWMLIHGLLHLLGYRHHNAKNAKVMEQQERLYLSRL